ncbi:winged helix-turn-helix domain-containing protein [Chroogloeocystis siderophila]|uniref:winged helix-turn-helix domain-containing protein n=1 Tax=Chroogloeocystis siderophila TaxID=329163 RepID=UPI001160F33D|nr:winged helix-turn-helix domain-containing protein [Chroogloeocystis siderophila]
MGRRCFGKAVTKPRTWVSKLRSTVQQWLAEAMGVEAEYHAVYQMTRYRLKAKLKVARPQNCQQDSQQREAFKKNLAEDLAVLSQYVRQVHQEE